MEKQILNTEQNYAIFLKYLKKYITRDGVDKLIAWLEKSDIAIAPASTKYHLSVEGGLVKHLLNTFYRLVKINSMMFPTEEGTDSKYSNETIALVALLHDISKVNFYEKTVKNTKVYSDTGSKVDEIGKFDWVSEVGYKVREFEDRLIYGSHSMNSVFMLKKFFNLTYEEELAILYHMGGLDTTEDEIHVKNILDAYKKSPLAYMLHMADLGATCIDEN